PSGRVGRARRGDRPLAARRGGTLRGGALLALRRVVGASLRGRGRARVPRGRGRLGAVGVPPQGAGPRGPARRRPRALPLAVPAFGKPLAVVTLCLPVYLDRNIAPNRARLTLDAHGALKPVPASAGRFLHRLSGVLFPYRSDGEVEEAFSVTAAILKATFEE